MKTKRPLLEVLEMRHLLAGEDPNSLTGITEPTAGVDHHESTDGTSHNTHQHHSYGPLADIAVGVTAVYAIGVAFCCTGVVSGVIAYVGLSLLDKLQLAHFEQGDALV